MDSLKYRVPVYCYTATDIATENAKRPDYSVIMTCGIDYRWNLILLDHWRKQGSHPMARMKEITRQVLHYKSKGIGIEENRAEDFISAFKYLVRRGEFEDDFGVMNPHDIIGKVKPLPHYGRESKYDRITEHLSSRLNSHAIYLRRKHVVLRDQFNDAWQLEFDDDIDCFSMICEIAKAPPEDYTISGFHPDDYDEYNVANMEYNPLTMSWN